jgi:hypothetical protein
MLDTVIITTTFGPPTRVLERISTGMVLRTHIKEELYKLKDVVFCVRTQVFRLPTTIEHTARKK